MNSYPEHHPWLKLFTVVSILVGVFVAAAGFASLSDPYDSEAVLYGSLALIGGIVIVLAGVHTLRATEGFKRWDSGVSGRDKSIGTLCIMIGGYVSIGLIIAWPLYKIFEGMSAEAFGVRRRR